MKSNLASDLDATRETRAIDPAVWEAFLQTPKGLGMIDSERFLLGEMRWDREPSVRDYTAALLRLRALKRRERRAFSRSRHAKATLAQLAAWAAFLESPEGLAMSDAEKRTLGSIRFADGPPTPATYGAILRALREAEPTP